MKSLSHVRLFVTRGLQPTRLLCPWDSPGKNTGVGCHFLLQGNLPNPGIKPGSPALQADALTSELPGKQAKWIFILLYKCFVQILWRWRLRWRTGCRWWGKGYLSIEALYAFKQKSTLHLEVVVVYLFVLALACFPGLIRNILKWEFYFVYFSCLS